MGGGGVAARQVVPAMKGQNKRLAGLRAGPGCRVGNPARPPDNSRATEKHGRRTSGGVIAVAL